MRPENEEHALRVQLATALRERDEQKARADAAEAETRKNNEQIQYACARAGKAEEALAAARRECADLRAVVNGMRETYCFHTCPANAPHEATCMDAAALAAPGAAADTSPATPEAWERRLQREAEVNDPNLAAPGDGEEGTVK